MMFGIPTICFYCFNGGWSDEVALGCIAIGAVLLGFSYFLHTALTYIVDEDGIRITRLGRTLYFLPWEQVKTIGIQKAYRGAFIVYVSRYDYPAVVWLGKIYRYFTLPVAKKSEKDDTS
jgi:hypothetical protein